MWGREMSPFESCSYMLQVKGTWFCLGQIVEEKQRGGGGAE